MAEVTREHRKAAAEHLDGLVSVYEECAIADWIETGEDMPSDQADPDSAEEFYSLASVFAQRDAGSEARGYARCQADVVAWLEAESSARFDKCDEHGPDMQDELSALGETLSGLADAVGKGTHVGAAGKAGG